MHMESYLQKEPKDRYEFVRAINKEMNIQSKDDYYQKNLEHPKYVADPEVYFSNQWVSWSHFLGVE